ncbi:MAG: hypothetical protein QM760_06075 [Nibricoccus sp.]
MDVDFSNDNWQLHDVVETWTRQANPTWTDDQVNAEIARVTKISTEEARFLITNANNGTLRCDQRFHRRRHRNRN